MLQICSDKSEPTSHLSETLDHSELLGLPFVFIYLILFKQLLQAKDGKSSCVELICEHRYESQNMEQKTLYFKLPLKTV